MEIWKDVLGYEGCYQISNLGRVKSLPNKKPNRRGKFSKTKEILIKGCINSRGYPEVQLQRIGKKPKHYKRSRLVALHFINNPENKIQVNHIDGDKLNSNVSNLEWVTGSENLLHAYKNGLKTITTKRKIQMLSLENTPIASFNSITDACNSLGVIVGGNIAKCIKGELKQTYGYKWKYDSE